MQAWSPTPCLSKPSQKLYDATQTHSALLGTCGASGSGSVTENQRRKLTMKEIIGIEKNKLYWYVLENRYNRKSANQKLSPRFISVPTSLQSHIRNLLVSFKCLPTVVIECKSIWYSFLALFSQNLEEGAKMKNYADIRQAGVCQSLDKSNIVAISDRWERRTM